MRSTSSHACPNSARSYPVLGARPLMGRVANRSIALVANAGCVLGAATAAACGIRFVVSGSSGAPVSWTDDDDGVALAVAPAAAAAGEVVVSGEAAFRPAGPAQPTRTGRTSRALIPATVKVKARGGNVSPLNKGPAISRAFCLAKTGYGKNLFPRTAEDAETGENLR